jgi:hypothetical protein
MKAVGAKECCGFEELKERRNIGRKKRDRN